jgi:predicted peptidase
MMKRLACLLSAVIIFATVASGLAQEAQEQQRRVPFGFGSPMASEELAKQPQTPGAKGDQQRHYFFEDAEREMPYHLYVPQSYDPAIKNPLVVALHGFTGNHDYFFAVADNLKDLCEKYGFIFVAPMGYSIGDWYGLPLTVPPPRPPRPTDENRADTAERPRPRRMMPLMPQRTEAEQLRDRARSEKDVMNVFALVRKEYNIDPNRIYLMGHSMGGAGTYFLGQKYNDIWAAIAPMSGTFGGGDYHYDRLKDMPILVSCGEKETGIVEAATAQLKEMHNLGMDAAFMAMPGGNHMTMIKPALPKIFKFFDMHRKPL